MTKVSYLDLIDLEKLKEQYHVIRTNTKNKGKLYKFEMFYSANLFSVFEVLKNKSYVHSHYHIFLVREPKYRVIMSENMSDKIINHMISKYILEPVITPKLFNFNVATRKNLGTKAGIDYVKKYINQIKFKSDKIYVLKCDIKKYFYNIDHEILLKKLKELIKDEDLYQLLNNILSSTNLDYINESIYAKVNLEKKKENKNIEELNKIPIYKKNKGLPIGNMTSQILAIFYLNDLDHYIKDVLHVKYYVRYMDDFILFDTNVNRLKRVKLKIEEKLKELKLELNEKTRIYDLDHGFNFLGYFYFLKDKKLIIKIRKDTKKKLKRKLKYCKKEEVRASYKGYLKKAHAKSLLYDLRLSFK